MSMAIGGLRGKSLMALLLACLVALLPSVMLGWQVLDSVYKHMGQAYARSMTLLDREKLMGPVLREYALSQRFSQDELMRDFLLDENNTELRDAFFRSAELWRLSFRDKAYFVASGITGNYYFNSHDDAYSERPRHVLNSHIPDQQWFFNTMTNEAHGFNINVDINSTLNTIKVWLNWVVADLKGERIGVAGTGMNLTRFVDDFVQKSEPGVLSMIIGQDHRIQLHPDKALIALNSGTGGGGQKQTLLDLLEPGARSSVEEALEQAAQNVDQVHMRFVRLGQQEHLLALLYMPELKWYVVNLVDLSQAQVIEGGWEIPLAISVVVLPLLLLIGFGLAVERLVLRPIEHLKRNAWSIASGHYDLQLPAGGRDEIGQLGEAFSVMAEKVRQHTTELEGRVSQRTQALEQAHHQMVAVHQKIRDSINYAGLIQGALLPKRELMHAPGVQHALLWRPRDVVGGDLYLFHRDERGYLFGLVDCAGHGVPGALMTMLAHATINQAISDLGLQDPAAILSRVDGSMREMLLMSQATTLALATNMDMGLAYVDLTTQELVFSGAKLDLYYSDGEVVDRLLGARRAVGERRCGNYQNVNMSWTSAHTFYIATDGLLDQSGGEQGYGFGRSRFTEMIFLHAGKKLSEQIQEFDATIAHYQGKSMQRDDMTLLCMRFVPEAG